MNHTDPLLVYILGAMLIFSGFAATVNEAIPILVGMVVMFVGVAISGGKNND